MAQYNCVYTDNPAEIQKISPHVSVFARWKNIPSPGSMIGLFQAKWLSLTNFEPIFFTINAYKNC